MNKNAQINVEVEMKVAIIGASGYVGAELTKLLVNHAKIELNHLLVSENSDSTGLLFSELHPRFANICDLSLEAFSSQWLSDNADQLDAVFLATPHEYSAAWAEAFLQKDIKVFDLSGGFRLKQLSDYQQYYGFEHGFSFGVETSVYGLAEWYEKAISTAQLIAVPGCYPTASLLALKPITQLSYQDDHSVIAINGISGVSGAGRKASLATSFNEVSLTPYNILQHRHQPEISQEANAKVIFNPHLAPYKRGLMTTITLKLKDSVTSAMVDQAYDESYRHSSIVRMSADWPKIDNVAHTPFADLHWKYDEQEKVLVTCCAIDNLLKGAASQTVQCANLTLGLPSHYSLFTS